MLTIYISTYHEGWRLKFQSADREAFLFAVSSLKNYIDHWQRQYDPETRHWFIEAEARPDFYKWLENFEASHAVSTIWNGPGTHHPPPVRNPAVINPYAVLHLLPSAPPELVKAAYKALAQIYHPDKTGGDDETMRAINAAYERLAA